MRKFLSIIMSLCLFLSVVTTIPFSVSADEIIEPTSQIATTNTYDEDGAVYKSYILNGGTEFNLTDGEEIDDAYELTDCKGAYTVRTYNGNNHLMTEYDAVIRPYAEGNYSAFLGVHQNGFNTTNSNPYYYPNMLWIYNSNDENLGYFVPKANTSYKIKFNWRSDGTNYDKNIFLSLARRPNRYKVETNWYSSDYAYIEKMVYISEQSSDWQTAEATFTTGSDVSELFLALHSDATKNLWNTDVRLWIDDIEVTEYTTGNATLIDFEDKQSEFYGVQSNLIGDEDQIGLAAADGHGNVMHLSKLKVYRKNSTSWNTVKAPTAFRIIDKFGNGTLYFEAGKLYDVSFRMKKNAEISNQYFPQITAALVFDSEYSYCGGNVLTWVDNGNTATVAEIDLSADSDWVTYTATIEVPKSGYGAFMLYGSGNDENAWITDCDIDIDDLSVSPTPNPQIKETVIDFEDQQKTYQTDHSVSENGGIITTDTEHGTVYHVTKLAAYKPEWDASHWVNNYNPGFIITEPGGLYTAEYNKGDILSVSYKIKKSLTPEETEKTNAIYTSMVFGIDVNTAVSDKNIGSTKTLKNNGNLVDLNTLDLTTDEDFVTYTAKVAVPTDGYAAFMLYVDDWQYSCDIYVDDVEISLEKETTVSFNEAQTSYINENTVGYNCEIIASEDADHGNVMNFKRIVAQNVKNSIWNEGSPAAFSVLDSTGKGVLWYKAGDELTVSVQIKKPAEIDSTYFNEFYAALTFVDSADTPLYEYIATLVEENRVVKVATLDNSASDWVTYTTTLTVPHDGYAVFMVYGTKWCVDTSVLVDNLLVRKFDASTLNRNGDVNGDKAVDIRDLVHIKKIAVGEAEAVIVADIDFDGIIAGAGDLTKLRKFLLGADSPVPYTKSGRTLVWNEEFEYANAMNTNLSFTHSMDTSVKAEELGYTVEYNNALNHSVKNGALNLSVGKTETGYSACEGITTKDHMLFKYGYLEMRAKVPFSKGAWPSLWMLGNTAYHDKNAQWFAEIDIFEVFSSSDTLHPNIHKHDGQGSGIGSEQLATVNSEAVNSYTFKNADDLSNEYHIYGFEWNDTQMMFYVDGECYYTFDYEVYNTGKNFNGIDGFKEFMYIQLNNEIYTSVLDGTDAVNADYSIDYLRIYQNAANGEEIIY